VIWLSYVVEVDLSRLVVGFADAFGYGCDYRSIVSHLSGHRLGNGRLWSIVDALHDVLSLVDHSNDLMDRLVNPVLFVIVAVDYPDLVPLTESR
jgi:hypothetical protein